MPLFSRIGAALALSSTPLYFQNCHHRLRCIYCVIQVEHLLTRRWSAIRRNSWQSSGSKNNGQCISTCWHLWAWVSVWPQANLYLHWFHMTFFDEKLADLDCEPWGKGVGGQARYRLFRSYYCSENVSTFLANNSVLYNSFLFLFALTMALILNGSQSLFKVPLFLLRSNKSLEFSITSPIFLRFR